MKKPTPRIKTPIANFLMGIAGNKSLPGDLSERVGALFRDVQQLERDVQQFKALFAEIDTKKFNGDDPEEIVQYALDEFEKMENKQ